MSSSVPGSLDEDVQRDLAEFAELLIVCAISKKIPYSPSIKLQIYANSIDT